MKKRITYQLPAAQLSYNAVIKTSENDLHFSQYSTLTIETVPGKGWLAAPLLMVEKKNDAWLRTLNNPADRVVGELQAALSGLQLKVNGYGQPVMVANHPAVWKQWLVLRDKLSYTYNDAWTAGLLQRTDATLLHKDELLSVFMKDLIWQEYFRDIYGRSSHQRMAYGITGPIGIPLQEKDEYNNYTFSTQGQWKEQYPSPALSSWKKLKGLPADIPLSVTYSSTYHLHPDTHHCDKIQAAYTLQAANTYRKIIHVDIVHTSPQNI